MAMSQKKRDELAVRRKKQILDAALQLFTKKGYENTSIQDIADAADISKGLVYKYFVSKLDILIAFQSLIDDCNEEIRNMPSPTESLRLSIQRSLFEPEMSGYLSPMRVYLSCITKGILDDRQLVCKGNYDSSFFVPIIKKGQELHEFRDGSPEVLASLLFHCILGYVINLINNPDFVTQLPSIDDIIGLIKKYD